MKLNSKILFDNFDTDEVDYEIIDLMLDEENRNNLIVKVKVFLKSNPEINYELISSKLFNKDVNQIIDDISFNNFDQFFSVDYEEIKKLTLNEFLNLDISKKLEYFKTEKTWISNFFKFEIKNDFEYIDDRLFATFNILFNKQVIKSWKIPTIKTINFLENKEEIERYRDSLDLEKIMQIIRGNTSSLMTKIKFKKDAKWSHINYLASDAKKAFEEIYELPKYGKYEIFIKDIKNVNNFDGRADLILWYKENGVEAPINNPREVFNNLKRLGSFKLLNFDDLIPENGKFFEANDFENSIESPSQAHIDAINSINESNFALRMSYGIFRDVNYRSINVLDMIEQQAFIKMEYLLEIKNGENRKGENFENDAYVPLSAKTYDKEITVNTTNLSDLKNNYFIYYYDVKAVGKRGMSFKLGFINKRRNEIRYTTDKEYTLINIVNDFQQSLYPEIMVNNIKLSDLEINYDLLSQKTALYYTENMNELNEVIKLRSENDQIRYKNYYLPVRLFKVAELKKITNDEAYIRFSVLDKNNSAVLGNTWYKIKGFLTSEIDNSKQILNFSDENLKTIQDSKNSITRERVIEPFWKDLIWSLDKNINTAYWTLKKKYLEQTFLRTNTKNRILKFNILANSLVNNSSKDSRVRNFDNSISLEVNFDDLIKKQSIEFRKTSYANDLKINYFINLSWNEEKGIDFKISMEDNDNKIIIDEPEAQRFEQGITFDRTRAFIILPAAVKTVISYTNDEELEDFKQNQNRFDYNEVEYNEYNQPILFSSDLEFQKNREIYHPNQNVKFKLHEGYKLNVDYLRVRQYRGWDIVETAYSRAALYDGSTFFGTIGFLGKVNNNPNDATFYVLTNHHVEGSGLSNFNDVVGNNFLAVRNGRNYAFAPDRIGSNVNRFYNLRTSGATSIFNNQIKIIWTGKEQISKDGRVTNKTQDLTMFVIDLNSKLREARSAGNMQVVWKIENLMKKSNVKMDIDYRFGEMSVPNIREISTMGWPGTRYSGSINRRPALASDTTIRVSVQNNYVQVYNGGGASGSGMFLNDDSYIATWTAGSGGPWSQGYRYDDRSYNFFGINWENENPLTLKNYRSVASQIFKANLRYPEKFDLPWFLKEINN
ncbi:hypothetical protein NX772_01325 [Mesomycoplasma molare]|uniref:Uncharacterized protein n=1 Tax=Mesomycoplasma molare TaxID=171288 RepID=A0ABY5TVU0_9BACT|nr:hypothetical protein [Mesomycoplasma molare]UWD34454.1 hypothetical protein NX772_01325 [Mesomycoplasma molare]